MKKSKKIGRPKKADGDKKEKVYARLYSAQLATIKKHGFSGLQDFLDEKIKSLEET